MQNTNELLYNMWYVAASSHKLRKGKLLPLTMLGQQVLLGRTSEGEVFALRDFCPHRGIPLRYGHFDGHEIECCYHGWCFNKQGQCTKIPSLTPEDNTDVSRIKTQAFPCEERDSAIWVYIPTPKTRVPENLPDVPSAPIKLDGGYYCVDSVLFPCNIDHAVIGLMDPSHGPYVHQSWWWRSQRSMHVKQKQFEPVGHGFKMASHKPSSNSRAYRILGGGDKTTEITFQLPGFRTEHITIGKKHIVLLTALTPVDEGNTMLHQFMYSNIKLLNFLRPLLLPFGKAFIGQDLDIVKKQQEGLRGDHPSLMLLGDADAQALWYFKLKRDYLEAQQGGLAFENRIPAKLLRWRS